MSRRMIFLMLLSAMVLVFAACEAADVSDEQAAEEPDDVEVVDDDDADDVQPQAADDGDADEEADEPTPAPDLTPTPEPEPTATPEPTEAPEAEEGMSRDNPIQLGEPAIVGEWEIRVIDTTPNATEIVLEENQFNDPPVEGNQFFITRIEATYVGDESGDFWIDTSLKAVDDGGVVYEGMDARCGVIPDNITDRGEAFPGATIEGNTCWSVNSEMTDSLLMIAEETFCWDGNRYFFALSE